MKFRRKSTTPAETAEQSPEQSPEQSTEQSTETAERSPANAPASAETPTGARARGPWDTSEVDLESENDARVDLGGLLVKGQPGLELRLQVDEATQQVAAVMFVDKEGALELRPFAAPRNGGIWPDIRKQIAAETARRGGTATEAEGTFGTELHVVMPAKTPDGQAATQPSRVLGIEGPRWLLRATFLGRPAVQPDDAGALETALREVVVVRGTGPMGPGEPLPLTVPANARQVQPKSP